MSIITEQNSWTPLQKLAFWFVGVFVLLVVAGFPVKTDYLPSPSDWTAFIFEPLIEWVGRSLFRISGDFTVKILSDSTGFYIHVFNSLCIAFLIASIAIRWGKDAFYNRAWYALRVLIRYYLAFELLFYGFNKVFKYQFFLPEPNTLYTTLGNVPKDLLFWSSMGSSYVYTVFGGVMEVGAALLLLFRKTALVGALAAFGVLLNVFMINIGFNISVKVFSCFMLFLSGILIAPHAQILYQFLIHKKAGQLHSWMPDFQQSHWRWIYAGGKTFAIWLLFFEILTPYFYMGNFNDDISPRPPMHGAYQVVAFYKDGYSIPAMEGYTWRWKRVFVHRRGHLIVQTMDDRMQSYKMQHDVDNQSMKLIKYQDPNPVLLTYKPAKGGIFFFTVEMNGATYEITTEQQDLKQLPLLKSEFYWTIDDIGKAN